MCQGAFRTHQCMYVSLCDVLERGVVASIVLRFSHNHFRLFSISFAVAINPNGRNYASGAEDGYVRLHFFDKSYLDMKDPVPEATEEGEDEEEQKVPE